MNAFTTIGSSSRILLGLVCAACGTTHTDGAPDIERKSQDISSANAAMVLGFEDAALWQATSGHGTSLTTDRVEGESALRVLAQGWTPLSSAPFVSVGGQDSISVNLALSLEQPNPGWFGALHLYVDAPACGVYDAYVDHVELTGPPTGVFQTLEWNVPAEVAPAFAAGCEVRLEVVLNVPHDATGAYLLDAIDLGGQAVGPGAPTPTGDRLAMSFDGDGDFIGVGASSDLAVGAGDFTLSAWVNIPSDVSASGQHSIAGRGLPGVAPGHQAGYRLAYEQDTTKLVVDNGFQSYVVQGTGVLSRDTWHHIVGVRAGAKLSLYVDGQLIDTRPILGYFQIQTPRPFVIGAALGFAAQHAFDGGIDNVAFYTRALSGSEVAELGVLGPMLVDAELQGFWSFDDGTARNLTSSVHFGTLFGDVRPIPSPLAALLASFPISDSAVIDGQLNPTYLDQNENLDRITGDFTQIIEQTGVQVLSTGESSPLSTQVARVGDFDQNDTVQVVRHSSDYETGTRAGALSILFYMQSPYAVGSSQTADQSVRDWFDAGIRVVNLAYSQGHQDELTAANSRYAGSADDYETGGLTTLGQAVVQAMYDRYMIVDVSHLNQPSTLEVIALAKARGRPVLANHANAIGVHANDRNKTDDEICGIAQTGGVIGLMPIGFALGPVGDRATEKLIEHIDYVRELDCLDDNGDPIPMIDHIAVSADSRIDGWDPNEPEHASFFVDDRMNAPSRWQTLAGILRTRATNPYRAADLRRLFGDNLRRVYRLGLPGLRDLTAIAELLGSGSVRFTWAPPIAQNTDAPTHYSVFVDQEVSGEWVRVGSFRELGSFSLIESFTSGHRYRWYLHARNDENFPNDDRGVWVNTRWSYFTL